MLAVTAKLSTLIFGGPQKKSDGPCSVSHNFVSSNWLAVGASMHILQIQYFISSNQYPKMLKSKFLDPIVWLLTNVNQDFLKLGVVG